MGEKINDDFFNRNPEFLKGLKAPEVSDEAREIYEFISDNPYTINRGVGMGIDVTVAPDMSKILPLGKEAGIDVYTYKEFFSMYVNKQRKIEEKQKKQKEKTGS